jgi:hypothetical protein
VVWSPNFTMVNQIIFGRFSGINCIVCSQLKLWLFDVFFHYSIWKLREIFNRVSFDSLFMCWYRIYEWFHWPKSLTVSILQIFQGIYFEWSQLEPDSVRKKR